MSPWLKYAIGAHAGLLLGMGLGRFSYTPMIPILIEAGHLDEAEAGYIAALNLSGYVLGALLVPRLKQHINEAYLIKLCLLLSLLALIASILPLGFLWLAIWRLSAGILVAAIMILCISYVTRYAPRNKIAMATGISFTGVGMGIFFSAAILPHLLEYGVAWGWAGSASIGTLATLVGLWAWHGAPSLYINQEQYPRLKTRLSVDGKKLVLVQVLFSIGLIPHSIYWVDYLVRDLGEPIEQGTIQWVLVGLGGLLGTILWGRLADRIGLNISLVLVFSALASSALLPVFANGILVIVFSSLIFGSQPGSAAIIAGRAQKSVGEGSMIDLWRYMVIAVGGAQLVGGFFLVELFNITGNYHLIFLVGGTAFALASAICATLTPVSKY